MKGLAIFFHPDCNLLYQERYFITSKTWHIFLKVIALYKAYASPRNYVFPWKKCHCRNSVRHRLYKRAFPSQEVARKFMAAVMRHIHKRWAAHVIFPRQINDSLPSRVRPGLFLLSITTWESKSVDCKGKCSDDRLLTLEAIRRTEPLSLAGLSISIPMRVCSIQICCQECCLPPGRVSSVGAGGLLRLGRHRLTAARSGGYRSVHWHCAKEWNSRAESKPSRRY